MILAVIHEQAGRYIPKRLLRRLLREPAIFACAKRKSGSHTAGSKARVDEDERISKIDHYMLLLQTNHQRVAASISHISLMIAVLLFSYNYILNTSDPCPLLHAPPPPNHSQYVIAVEVIIYLCLAVALISCLKDVGLDRLYGINDRGVRAYERDFVKRLVCRYLILGFSNICIRFVTILFAVVIAWHYYTTATTKTPQLAGQTYCTLPFSMG